MKSATQLRHDLASVFDELRAGAIDTKQASELANLAGKMISSAKAQLEYYELTGQKPVIPFLEETAAVTPPPSSAIRTGRDTQGGAAA